MKIYSSHINDFPFVDFHHWEFKPIELLELYLATNGERQLADTVRHLDHVYVRFRELDALENRIGSTLERLGMSREEAQREQVLDLSNLFNSLAEIIDAKRTLILGVDKEELSTARESLLTVVHYLESKGKVELKA